MQAKDVMTANVVSVSPDTSVEEIAELLLSKHISGVPVLDAGGRLLGIVSEGDLMRRSDQETERPRSWWLSFLTRSQDDEARDYVKSHGRCAEDVMTREVYTVKDSTPIADVAALLEKRRIKRVPVLRDGTLVGIVSRANLLQGLAAHKGKIPSAVPADDASIRKAVLARLDQESWVTHPGINVTVTGGRVELWGWVESEEEQRAITLAVESVPGVNEVEVHLGKIKPYLRGA